MLGCLSLCAEEMAKSIHAVVGVFVQTVVDLKKIIKHSTTVVNHFRALLWLSFCFHSHPGFTTVALPLGALYLRGRQLKLVDLGSASDFRSECCAFKSRQGQSFSQSVQTCVQKLCNERAETVQNCSCICFYKQPFPIETLSKNRMFPLRNLSIRFDISRPSLSVK